MTSNLLAYLGFETLITAGPIQQWQTTFVATPAAIGMYQQQKILECLDVLQCLAERHDGLDYLQVFEDESKPENLWSIEDGPGGAITSLLSRDY